MIISCPKCNKKFELSDKLIPENGRLLQCGSCSHQWHYTSTSKIKLINEIDSDESLKKIEKINHKQKIKKNKNKYDLNISNKKQTQNQKKVGFLSYLIVFVISFIALLVVVETFKSFIISFIPNIDFYLSSLYESLRDIILFIKDLLK